MLNATLAVNATGPGNYDRFASFTGSRPGDYVGTVAIAGDVNGDGFADAIVGAAGQDTGLTNVGKAYIFLGGLGMDGVPDLELVGTEEMEGFGCSVAGAGDVNGDGYDDVIVGAYGSDAGADTGGRAYIFFGGSTMDYMADVIITGSLKNQALGTSVTGAGDLNHDGYDDVVVGGRGTSPGWANIYFGGTAMDNVPDVYLVGNGGGFGDPVAGIGDVNGDGFDDIMIGEGSLDAGGSHIGRAYVYYGGAAINSTPDVTFTGEASEDFFGSHLSGAGDVDMDGCADVIVGAPGNDAGGQSAGRAYLFLGGASMDNLTDMVFTGEAAWDYFGSSVAGAGDVNEDGYDDVLIGGGGKAHLYYGGSGMDNASDLILQGEGEGDHLGGPYSASGDLDGDGHEDLIVGDAGNATGGQYSGAAYFYHWVPVGGLEVSIYSKTIWDHTRRLNGTNSSLDFVGILNQNLRYAMASGTDEHGNSYVDVPVGASARSEGYVIVGNINIIYEYTANVPDFKTELNSYIQAHQNDQDSQGNITVRLRLASETAGKAKLSDLAVLIDEPPALEKNIPNYRIPEDTAQSELADFCYFFDDDYTPDSQLQFAIVSATNQSIVHVDIERGRFLSVDASEGDQNDNWTGIVRIIVRAMDGSGLIRDSNPFSVVVTNVPDPPIITSVPRTDATGGMEYIYDLTAIDGDNDPLIYGIATGPRNMTMNETTGRLTWTTVSRGTYPISLTVYDGTFTIYQDYSISVPNRLPRITNTTVPAAIAGKPFRYRIPAVDDDDDAIVFSLLSNIPGIIVDSATGEINWTPFQTGVYPVSFRISDPVGFLEYEFCITVMRGNRPPLIRSIPIQNATIGIPYSYDVLAIDNDGDALLYMLITGPIGMSIEQLTGSIIWMPDSSGIFNVCLKVTDGNGGEARQDFNITVLVKTRPVVLIESPRENASIQGRLNIKVVLVKGTLNITGVQYRLDGGKWINLTYNDIFVFNIDTTGLPYGGHLLEMRAFDGTDYSETAKRRFLVDNPDSAGWLPAAAIIALIGILFAFAFVLLWNSKMALMRPKKYDDEE